MTTSANQGPDQRPVALVTGAGAKRVGHSVAWALAAAGYRLVLHAHRSIADAEATATLMTDGGTPAIAVAADLSQELEVQRMVAAAHQHFGRLDALVNCAAIWRRKPFLQVTADDVRDHFEANTLGTFLCCQQVGRVMIEQASGGGIVNFGDWATVRPYRDYAAYFPSKGAIPAMTRSLAVELAALNPNIRVNAILPGPAMLPEHLSPEEHAKIIASTLLKRAGSPQNLADAVLFLLRNDFVTGVCLPVDGGRGIYAGD